MILTALRKGSELSLREVNETDGFHSPAANGGMWFCADEDYQTAVHIYRLAMILTALRKGSELSLREVNETDGFHSLAANGGTWFCADEDYQTAELIGNKLILHMAQAYQMIEGHEKHTLPEVKALDQKQILLSLLPKEFESRMLINEAKAQGISARTSTRWNEEWIAQGIVIKVRHGHYKKQDACA